MKKLLCLSSLLLPLAILPLSSYASEIVSENRNIDAKTQKIVLDGVVNLSIKQGPTASLVVSAEKGELNQITVSQNGDTIHVGSSHRGKEHRIGNLKAEITLPMLQELVIGGVGKSDVAGFSGDSIRLDLKGAGALNFQGSYKDVRSHLSGVGSMVLNLSNNDNTEFKLSGLGSATLKGQSKKLRADLSGLGSLEAKDFIADTLDLRLKGMGSASAYAKQNAAVSIAGMGSATVYGKPVTRNASSAGMGSITWKE